MLKSTLIKLRRQPKVVREQAALIVAGGFTFLVFGVWAFNLPNQLSVPEQQTASVIDSLKEDFANDSGESINFERVSEGFQNLRSQAASTSEETPSTEVDTTPKSDIEIPPEEVKEVRIITTSSSSEPE